MRLQLATQPVTQDMTIPNADRAIVAAAKLTGYYGVVYEIEGPMKTPSGKTVRFCSIWQVDTGTDLPRFITMYPR